MVWRDAIDGEGRDPFASATGTFIIHLFVHDRNKYNNMTQAMVDSGNDELGGQR